VDIISDLSVTIPAESDLDSSAEGSLTSPSSTQTPMSLTSAIPRKKKLRSKLQLLKREKEHLRVENTNLREQPLTCTKEQFQELSFKMCPPELAKFISIQFQLSNRLLHVRRYSKEFKFATLFC
jgi:hypothetical protein